MNPSAVLFRIQVIDNKLSALVKEIAHVEHLLRDDSAVSASMELQKQKQHELLRSENQLKNITDKRKSCQIKVEQSEAALYGGKIRNPKELQDLEHEIRSLKSSIPGLEENEIGLMLELEQAQAELDLLTTDHEKILAARGIIETDLLQKLAQLQKDQSNCMVEVEAARQSVPADSLLTYDRLRKNKAGIAVVEVVDNNCSVCGAEVSISEWQNARTGTQFILCQGCGRIIYGN